MKNTSGITEPRPERGEVDVTFAAFSLQMPIRSVSHDAGIDLEKLGFHFFDSLRLISGEIVGLIGIVHPPAAGGKHYDREVR